jgi:hypothetical protein
MAYLLPRVVIVLIVWAMSCVAIKKIWPEADPMFFGFAGACWALGGTAYFGYLRKLRRDIEELERNRRYGLARSAADSPLSPAE